MILIKTYLGECSGWLLMNNAHRAVVLGRLAYKHGYTPLCRLPESDMGDHIPGAALKAGGGGVLTELLLKAQHIQACVLPNSQMTQLVW